VGGRGEVASPDKNCNGDDREAGSGRLKADSDFCNGELIGNLPVPIAVANQLQYLYLSTSKIFGPQMLGEAYRNICWHVPFASVHRPDDTQQFILRHTLKDIS
jgi:hypothetical protein